MMKREHKAVALIAFLAALTGLCRPAAAAHTDPAARKSAQPRTVQQALGAPASTLMNINNLAMWARDDGLMERRPQDLNAGVTFPRGTTTVVYAGGLVWGGLVNDGASPLLRVGGQTYNYGTVPGRILSPGVKESPDAPDVHIYRIRRDWDKADLAQDAAEFNDKPLAQVTPDDIAALRAQYKKDWLEWPWQKGAPYYDRNGNGVYDPDPSGLYDPSKDEPGFGGGDQVIWFVANDLDAAAARGLYGSPPIGIEMQVTCWAYARSNELGNVIFQRYKIIYKGTATTPPNAAIDSMYLAKWVDPDNGDYGDDYAGCDSTLSLGYDYNSSPNDAEFKKFDLSGGANGGPPAVGYDFFQGPKVGGRVLPMTTFAFFAAGGRDSDPDLSNYEGTKQWYNLLRGYRPRPVDPPQCNLDISTNPQQCTHYELSGDLTTLKGWIDGRRDPPGDRRIVLASGPIRMALGDTQEVVVGLMGAIGEDNIQSVEVLKNIDRVAQKAFDLHFELPSAVPPPPLKLVELDQKVILDWESDTAQVRKVESYSSQGYTFDGYNLYQLPSAGATKDQAKIIQPFDITTPRSMEITRDKFRSRPLVDGQKYYFAVTATATNTLLKDQVESQLLVKVAIPHSPNPGVVYPYPLPASASSNSNVALNISNKAGVDDARITLSYFDPTKPDGHAYFIRFDTLKQWTLVDFGTNARPLSDTLLRLMPINSGWRFSDRGFSLQVVDAAIGIKGVYQVQSGGQPAHDYVFGNVSPQGSYEVLARVLGPTSLDSLAGANTVDRDVEWRFTGDSSWAVLRGGTARGSRWLRVPYTAWQIAKDASQTTRQVYTVITGQGQDSVWRPTQLFDVSYNGKPLQTFYPVTIVTQGSLGGTAAIYDDSVIYRRNGNTTLAYLWSVSGTNIDQQVAINKAIIADLDRDGAPAPKGTVIRFEKFKSILIGDQKVIQTTAVDSANFQSAKQAIDAINVFPNPYYGVNRAELSRFRREVKFNHLPAYAKIRIFNLAGILVRTLEQATTRAANPNSPTQFLSWDLNNENGLPVASGMYIAYLELKDVDGKDLGTKTLKLMIVQEQQFLDSY